MMEYPIKLDQVDKLVPRSARFDEKEMSFRLQLVDYGRDWAEELLFDILSVPKSLKPPPVDHFNIHNQLSTIQSVAQEFLLKTFKDQKGHISTQTLCNVSRALAEEIEVEEDFLKWTEVLIQASGKDLTGLSDSFMKRLLEKPPRPTSQHHQIDGIEQQEIESTCLFDQLEIETKVCLWANVPTLWDEQVRLY
jgi:hypothetical protein